MLLAANLGIQAILENRRNPSIQLPLPRSNQFQYTILLSKECRTTDLIVGDGNCLFHALSKALFDDQQFHQKLRQILVTFIENNQNCIKLLILATISKSIKMKFTIMEYVYGTQIELQAAATFLQIPIYVYIKPYAIKDWQCTCTTP